jgi:putative MATE family efflux protein
LSTTPAATESLPARRGGGLLQAIRSVFVGTDQDFTEGNLTRAILLLAIPMVLEMAMESLFALVNMLWVSRLGAAALASIGLTEGLMALVYTVAIGFAMAGTAMVARRIGEKDPRGASIAAAQVMWLAVAAGALMGLFGGIFAPDMLRLMGASQEVVSAGSGYARIMLGGQVVVILLFVLNGAFRGTGDAAMAMRTLWIANAVNLVLDPCLIFGLGPFPQLGLTGTAVATTVGRGVGVLVQLYFLFSGKRRIHLRRDTLAPDPKVIGRLALISLGGMGQYFIATVSWAVLVRIISRFGDAAVAGYTVAIRVVFVAFLPAWGMSNAAATLVGQNLGAGKPERAEQSVFRASVYNMAFMGAVALVLIFGTRLVLTPFGADPSVVPTAVATLRTLSYGFVFYGLGMVVVQSFNGAGDTLTPTIINVVTFWILQIPLAWVLSSWTGLGVNGVFWAVAIAYSSQAVIGLLAFRRGTWKTRTV